MKWNSIDAFFCGLNGSEYVVLRNQETLIDEIMSGGDIDILCANKQEIGEKIGMFPIVSGKRVFNYYTIIENKKVLIDIREIGDGYYDKKWELEMIRKRIRSDKYYILDDENYKYSLLYHALIHKYEISQKYIETLEKKFARKIGNNEDTYKLLCEYMCRNGYSITVPVDEGVIFNNKNVGRLYNLMDVSDYQ